MSETYSQMTRQNKRIRKGDKVIAITGNDKGKTGVVLSINGDRAVVQGLNMVTKHVKPNANMNKGGKITIENGIHLSNLMLCVKDNQPVKLRVKVGSNGDRELYYKDGNDMVTYRSLKKS